MLYIAVQAEKRGERILKARGKPAKGFVTTKKKIIKIQPRKQTN